jgi:hypothetical protein
VRCLPGQMTGASLRVGRGVRSRGPAPRAAGRRQNRRLRRAPAPPRLRSRVTVLDPNERSSVPLHTRGGRRGVAADPPPAGSRDDGTSGPPASSDPARPIPRPVPVCGPVPDLGYWMLKSDLQAGASCLRRRRPNRRLAPPAPRTSGAPAPLPVLIGASDWSGVEVGAKVGVWVGPETVG